MIYLRPPLLTLNEALVICTTHIRTSITEPGARDGWSNRDMMAIRGTLLWNMPTDGRLKLKVFTSRDQSENQVSDSVQGVSNNGFLEPDDDPYNFSSSFYATRDKIGRAFV